MDMAISSIDESLAILKGEASLATWTDLPLVDLAEIEADFDFEAPGLHKRVRACLGSLINRSNDNVIFDWTQICLQANSGYNDYDRVWTGVFSTQGSTWGSSRGADVCLIWAKHVSSSDTISDEPLYLEGFGLFGTGTDSKGTPAVAFKLFVPAHPYDRRMLHPEVQSLWNDLVSRATDEILERLIDQD